MVVYRQNPRGDLLAVSCSTVAVHWDKFAAQSLHTFITCYEQTVLKSFFENSSCSLLITNLQEWLYI